MEKPECENTAEKIYDSDQSDELGFANRVERRERERANTKNER